MARMSTAIVKLALVRESSELLPFHQKSDGEDKPGEMDGAPDLIDWLEKNRMRPTQRGQNAESKFEFES